MVLSEYVAQIMKEKRLTAVDIQNRSQHKIADSHISNILKGKTKNLSIEKVNALAKGLGVDSIEIFKVASGSELVESKESWPGHILLRVMEKIIASPDLTAIVKVIADLKPAKIKALRKQLEGVDK